MWRGRRKLPFWGAKRFFSADDSCGPTDKRRGVVLGVYQGCNPGEYFLTPAAAKFDATIGNRLSEIVKKVGIKKGEVHVIHNLGQDFYAVAAAGAGEQGVGYNESETLNECKENIRIAAGAGVQALQHQGLRRVEVEEFSCAEAAAEGACLGAWKYEMYRTKPEIADTKIKSYCCTDKGGWERGVVKAEAQNIARVLEETPANLMTPELLAKAAIDILCPCGVNVVIRDRDWIESQGLTAFLQMSRSACTPPLFLEASYCGGGQDDKPVILVGKGVTYDSGGLCLRKCKKMFELKAEMAGAAVSIAVMKSLATLGIPMNVTALIPLCENMPGGQAIRPGDVTVGVSGKSIRVLDTGREGTVILSDLLTFAIKYKPCLVMSIANLTYGMRTALGGSSTGAFTSSDIVWRELKLAGADTGDRMWRMPLWRYFAKKISLKGPSDFTNVAERPAGEPCVGAAFLLQFAPPVDYVHMDITGTGMINKGSSYVYLRKGHMTGRPTRTVTQFLNQMACPDDKPAPC